MQYKLRDKNGQAREFNNYMLPVDMGDGGQQVFLLGMRESPAEPFRYLRLPADENSEINGFLRLRAAMLSPELRAFAGIGRKVMLVVNKSEGMKYTTVTADFYELGLGDPYVISAAHGDGVPDLVRRPT